MSRETNFFTRDGIAAWLQVAIAFSAAVYGFYVVESWQDQDMARKKSEMAGRMLERIMELRPTIHNMRLGSSVYAVEDLKGYRSPLAAISKKIKFEQLAKQRQAMELQNEIAKHYFEETHLYQEIKNFVVQAHRIERCVLFANYLNQLDEYRKSSKEWEDAAIGTLAAFLVYPNGQAIPAERPRTCQFDLQVIVAEADRLVAATAKFLPLQ